MSQKSRLAFFGKCLRAKNKKEHLYADGLCKFNVFSLKISNIDGLEEHYKMTFILFYIKIAIKIIMEYS